MVFRKYPRFHDPYATDGETSEAYEQWCSANYNEVTKVCTLFRGVDSKRAEDSIEHGAITSRVVEVFGDYDLDSAISGLEVALSSRPSPRVQKYLEDYIDAVGGFRTLQSTIGRVGARSFEEFYRGSYDNQTTNTMAGSLKILKIAKRSGKAAFHQASLDACKDRVPPADPIQYILYPYIHLTTSRQFAQECFDGKDALITCTFRPYAIPVGVSRAKDHKPTPYHTPHRLDGEQEWIGLGQIKSGKNVSIQVNPSHTDNLSSR